MTTTDIKTIAEILTYSQIMEQYYEWLYDDENHNIWMWTMRNDSRIRAMDMNQYIHDNDIYGNPENE